jgi:hypothetical protein
MIVVRKMASLIAHALTIALLLPGLALARGRCPPETAESLPILLRDPSVYEVVPGERGVDFSTPAHYWNRGTWFRMAHGYANPWIGPPNDRLRVDRDRYTEWLAATPLTGFDPATGMFNEALIPQVEKLPPEFAFWMPTLRPVERNRRTVPFYRPCEAGRPRPTWDEYVVAFDIDWPFLPGSEAASGARRFNIASELRMAGKPVQLQGMRNYEHTLDGPISGFKNYEIYSDDNNLAVMLGCDDFLPLDLEENPICAGYVWQRSSNLVLFVRFPSDRGQLGRDERWRAPVMAAISLVTSWRLNE